MASSSDPSPNPTEKTPDLELIQKESSNCTRIWACTWTPDGNLVTGGIDGTVKIWYLTPDSTFAVEKKNNTLITLEGNVEDGGNKAIVSVALHPDGDVLAASALDGSVHGYLFSTQKVFSILARRGKPKSTRGRGRKSKSTSGTFEIYPTRQLQFSPKGEYLAGARGSKGIKLWQKNHQDKWGKATDDINVPGTENKDYVVSIAWNSQGTQMACGTTSGAIYVLPAPDFKAISIRECPTKHVVSLAYSPLEEHTLVSGSHDNLIYVHDTVLNKRVLIMKGHSHWVLTVEVSPDGDKLASGSGDRTVKLWDIKTGKLIRTTTQDDYVWSVKFKAVNVKSEVGVLASVSDDGSISVYKYPRISSS